MSEDKLTPSQQQAAVVRIGENLALRSGAGCGKTSVLARRFTELLLKHPGPESPLSRFVALTFTDKAALEMSQRVRKMIADFAAKAKGDDRRKLLGWLEELPDARISTIHSFCTSLLRSHAIDAGLDPAFTVCADELVTSAMVSQAADDAVLAAVESQQPDVAQLLTTLRYDELLDRVHHLVNNRTAFNASHYANADSIMARWQTLLAAERKAAWAKLSADTSLRIRFDELRVQVDACSDADDKLFVLIQPQLKRLNEILSNPAARTAAAFAQLDARTGGVGRKSAWGDTDPKTVRQTFKTLVEGVQEYALFASDLGDLDRLAAESLATMTQLSQNASALYAAEKRRRGLLDFTDLMDHAHRLLAGNPAVRDALRKQFDQLLVDEAQDVDPLQIELLTLLIFGQAQLKSPPDGRLFLVGDAKQSIYRFRGARVEVFSDMCNRLGAAKQQNLDLSFRTHEAGVAFANHLFAPLMQADYSPIQAHRKITPPQPSVEILLAQADEKAELESTKEGTDAQAAVVASRIRQMLDGGEQLVWDRAAQQWRAVQPRDVAILFNRMTVSPAYERELAQRDIPYYVVGGTGFFKQQEVYDVLNALRVIDNPFDDVALFGVLRSSIFGLDDNALMHIALASNPPYFPKLAGLHDDNRNPGDAAQTIPGLSPQQRQALAFAIETLSHLHRRKDAIGIDRIVEHLVQVTGFEAVLLSQFQGKRMLGNVRRLIDQARSAASLSLADFITQMNELVINESRVEQAAVVGAEENVVRLLTVHKAKGLEFPVVILPDLNAGRRGTSSPLLNRSDWGLTCKLKPGSDEMGEEDSADGRSEGNSAAELPLSYQLAKRLEDEDQRREEIRRFYVAVTRHEDHLIFVAANRRSKSGEFKEPDSCLTMLDSVLNLRQAVDAGAARIPYADGRFNIKVTQVTPQPPQHAAHALSPGRQMVDSASSAQGLADAFVKAAPAKASELPLMGPLPPDIGRVEVAVTALGEFELCPMLYRWRYELRVPAPPQVAHKAEHSSGLDALTLGTLFHRCMELADFAHPQPAGALLAQAAEEEGIGNTFDLAPVAEELDGMLRRLATHELGQALQGAKATHRELDFVMRLPHATLRGQIDLLYQDAAGDWHIVDYKSDRVGAEGPAAHAGRYELQMLTYAAAAGRFLGQTPVDATLYFLRPAATHTFVITDNTVTRANERIETLARQIIQAGRSGEFPQCPSAACTYCPYAELCRL